MGLRDYWILGCMLVSGVGFLLVGCFVVLIVWVLGLGEHDSLVLRLSRWFCNAHFLVWMMLPY